MVGGRNDAVGRSVLGSAPADWLVGGGEIPLGRGVTGVSCVLGGVRLLLQDPSRPCDGVARRNRPLSMIGVDAPRKWFATSETASRGGGGKRQPAGAVG